jgi:hypothetical protein
MAGNQRKSFEAKSKPCLQSEEAALTAVECEALEKRTTGDISPGGSGDSQPSIPLATDFEFQFAMDQFLTGTSDQPLAHLVAKWNGADPSKGTLVATPATDEWMPAGPSVKADWLQGSPLRRFKIPWVDKIPHSNTEDSAVVHPHYVEAVSDDAGVPVRDILDHRSASPSCDEMFEYTSLKANSKQIRLIRLGHPISRGLGFTIQLEVVDLDNAPKYNALSYVWGQSDRIVPLICNQKTIKLTANLAKALESCFSRYPETPLWADGICIYQDDVAERSQQVLLMGEIYSHASMVLAHLDNFAVPSTPDDGSDPTRREQLHSAAEHEASITAEEYSPSEGV